MAVESGWTSPSQKELTLRPRESTWDGPHMAEAVPAVLDVTPETTTAATIAAMTEAATIAMTTGNTTDLTEGDLHHRTTEALTGLDPDHDPILPVDIDRSSPSLRAQFLVRYE